MSFWALKQVPWNPYQKLMSRLHTIQKFNVL